MAEFRTMYYQPMDRQAHESITQTPSEAKVEDPIYPINELGETVPEAIGGRNILQTTEAAIRGGAGTLQLVLLPPQTSIGHGSVGARIGKEVREAVRELALANKVNIAGVELPTGLRGLSGFDFQQDAFSDELRRRNVEQVKDAIKFAADVGQGGGIDLLSWEFTRNISEAHDNKFEDPSEQVIGRVVDKRNGRTIPFRKTEEQTLPIDPISFKPTTTDEQGNLVLHKFTWEKFKEYVDHENKEHKTNIEPEVMFVRKKFEQQKRQAEGWKSRELERWKGAQEQADEIKLENFQGQALEEKSRAKKFLQQQAKEAFQAAQGHEQEARNMTEQIENLQPLQTYGLKRSADSYAEAGIYAMEEYNQGLKKGTIKKILHVGPEIGWPDYYGSHPDEFRQVIKESRKRMVELLRKEEVEDPSGKKVKSLFYNKDITEKQANELAKNHIKGLFDTGHMGMWLAHFKQNVGETEAERIERFNKWYKEKVKEIANDPDQLIGGIQLVDSHSAVHGHLPPGEGIFPVIESAKIFKNAGFKGFVVSEGHEEEHFGQGRIRFKAWQHAGANIGQGYFAGPPLRWQEPMGRSYFGRSYSPLFMFGSYSPSNDFKLWSEVPLE